VASGQVSEASSGSIAGFSAESSPQGLLILAELSLHHVFLIAGSTPRPYGTGFGDLGCLEADKGYMKASQFPWITEKRL